MPLLTVLRGLLGYTHPGYTWAIPHPGYTSLYTTLGTPLYRTLHRPRHATRLLPCSSCSALTRAVAELTVTVDLSYRLRLMTVLTVLRLKTLLGRLAAVFSYF